MKKMLSCRISRCIAWALTMVMLVHMAPISAAASVPDLVEESQDAQVQQEPEVSDIQELTPEEMRSIYGRGSYRNRYFCGTMPWQRTMRDVNVNTGNLFKSFTDIQVAPAQGAGLVLQRTYNSNDESIGPFGRGWTHAYDIRLEEAYDLDGEDGLNLVDRTDFFGGRHVIQRDADGLYTPPPYLHCTLESEYQNYLDNGPAQVNQDIEESLDGTIKHFVRIGNARVCDSIMDRHGNQTTLEYDSSVSTQALLTKVTDPSGRTLDFTWTPVSAGVWRITRIQGPMYSVKYEYYGYTDDQSITLDMPSELESSGGELYNLKRVILDPEGLNRITEYTYVSFGDETGLLAAVAQRLADPQDEERDAGGNLMHVVTYDYGLSPCGATAPCSGGWCEEYHSLWVRVVTEPGVMEANGYAVRKEIWFDLQPCDTRHIWTNYFGHIFFGLIMPHHHSTSGQYYEPPYPRYKGLWLVDINGLVEVVKYDDRMNVIQSRKNRAVKNTDRKWGDPTPDFWHFGYRIQESTYGPHGHQLSAGYAGQPRVTHEYYDESKYFNKSSIIDVYTPPKVKVTGFDYGDKDSLSSGDKGNLLWMQDALENEYTYEYDSEGRKTKETNPNGAITTFEYDDTWGNLTKVAQQACESGCGSFCTLHNRITTMEYDEAGRVTERIDPNGNKAVMQYNVLGQPTSIQFYEPNSATPEETVSYAYDDYGRLVSVTDGRANTSMSYVKGRDLVETVTDSITGTVAYTYRLSDAVETVTYPDGTVWTYEYYDANDLNPANRFLDTGPVHGDQVMPNDDLDSITERLVSIADNCGHRVDYDICIDGTLARATAMVPNGSQWSVLAETTYWYDEYYTGTALEPNENYRATRNWLVNMETVWAEEVENEPDDWRKVSFSYTYEDSGNRLTRTASELEIVGENWQVVGNPRTETYEYDDLYRLCHVDYGDDHKQWYTFDPMGNRLSKTDSASGNESYSYNKANMLISRSGQAYTNDLNGNTLTGGGRANTWDTQNRLRECVYNGTTTTIFTYGADGLRRSMKVGNNPAVHYLLNGQSVAQEGHLDGSSVFTPDVSYFSGIRGPECRYDHSSEKTIWYVYDGLGSVVGELELQGISSGGQAYAKVTATRKFDVYGLPRAGGTGTSATNHGFVGSLGHTAESSTGGLIYMRARWMDPEIGRFISEDPAGDGVNWYVYCRNNPVNLVDADGKAAEWKNILYWIAGYFGKKVVDKLLGCTEKIVGNWLVRNGASLVCYGVAEFELGVTEFNAARFDPTGVSTMRGASMCLMGAADIAMGLTMVGVGKVLLGLAYIEEMTIPL